MMSTRTTVQTLDPLAAVASRPLSILAVGAAVAYAIVVGWTDRAEITQPALAAAAFGLLALSALGVVLLTSPLRAPFRGRSFALVLGLANGAMVVAAISTWGMNADLRQDWGPIGVVLVILACASFRPAGEIAAAGLISASCAAALAFGQSAFVESGDPVLVEVVIAVTVVVALPLAAAAFVRVMVRSLLDWRESAESAARAMALESQDTLARSVQQDRVTILNRDVIPFFVDVLAQEQVTDDGRARALEISDSVRSAMVADIDRSWLDAAVDRTSVAVGHAVGAECVQDDDRLAGVMSAEQCTAVRALLVACLSQPGFDADGFGITLHRDREWCDVEWRVRIHGARRRIRAALIPYLSVVGVVFDGLRLDSSHPALTVRFRYEIR